METNINNFNSIKFIFAKPHSPNYYLYAIDTLDNLSIIDKLSLKKFLIKMNCKNFIKLNYILDRNLALFFNAETKTLSEYQNESVTRQELSNLIKSQLSPNQIESQSSYDICFGENSTFYKKEFNLWQ